MHSCAGVFIATPFEISSKSHVSLKQKSLGPEKCVVVATQCYIGTQHSGPSIRVSRNHRNTFNPIHPESQALRLLTRPDTLPRGPQGVGFRV